MTATQTIFRPFRLLLALLLTALLGTALAQYAITGERIVTFIMGDIYFEIEGQEQGEGLTVSPGEMVTFVVRNEGGMAHNVQFGRDMDPETRRYLDPETRRYQTELFPGFAGLDLDAGEEARLTLQMPEEPGEWEIGCLILGHYEAGQVLALVIE
jgi:uncharacterized cupredoxin-like copper-binding protein